MQKWLSAGVVGAGVVALVGSGAALSAAAPVAPAIPTNSTNATPIAVMLQGAGTTIATYRFANNTITPRGRSPAWSATPRWSASTTACRTASSTASATRAASTSSA